MESSRSLLPHCLSCKEYLGMPNWTIRVWRIEVKKLWTNGFTKKIKFLKSQYLKTKLVQNISKYKCKYTLSYMDNVNQCSFQIRNYVIIINRTLKCLNCWIIYLHLCVSILLIHEFQPMNLLTLNEIKWKSSLLTGEFRSLQSFLTLNLKWTLHSSH